MIQTLYTIGKVLAKDEEYQQYFEPFENPFTNSEKAKTAKVLVVEVNNGVIHNSISIEDFSELKVNKYLYRKIRGARGTNLVPTFYFPLSKKADETKWTEDQSESMRKLVNRIKKSIENNNHDFVSVEEVEKLEDLLFVKSKDLNKDNAYLITMKIDGNYFGQFDKYKELFEAEAYSKYYDKSMAKNKICSVSYQEEEEVWGRIDTLGFTVDKNAFRRNGFSEKTSYTMLPVSPEATKILEGSKRIITKELNRRFFNLNYFILPHFIDRENEDVIEEVLQTFIQSCSEDDNYKATGKSIISNEEILNTIIKDEKLQKNIYYDIMFYQQQQGQFLIKIQLSDVLPSRIQQIFEIKNSIEEKYDKITKIEYVDKKTKEKEVRHFYINFGVIKDYFSKKVKSDYVYQSYFFKILEAVFQGAYLNEQLILKGFMNKIRSDFKNASEVGEFTYQNQTKYTFIIYQYFLHLGLFKNKKNMEKQKEKSVPLTADDFIAAHPNFFDKDYKKGVFLLGNLCSYLMWVQYSELKNSPFKQHLNSLIIDKKTIKKIFPKAVNKLREYKKARPSLEAQIAKFLVKEYNLSNTDTSYIFTLGMVMQREFAKAPNENE